MNFAFVRLPAHTRRRSLFGASLGAFLLALSVGELRAATIHVTSLSDCGPGSLRQAILDANDSCGSDSIEFCTNGIIALSSPLPTIAENLSILGPGTNQLTISGSGMFPVFSMACGTTNVLSGLTIANGRNDGFEDFMQNPSRIFAYGSGISNAGCLRLVNCVVRDCTGNLNRGGGIYNAGTLTVDACAITNCGLFGFGDAQAGGGIYNGGTLFVTNSIISGCRSYGSAQGGAGIYNNGELFLTRSWIANCVSSAVSDGGGVLNRSNATINTCIIRDNFGFYGGAIKNEAWLAMTNSTISGNEANTFGGGLFLQGGSTIHGCTISSNVCAAAGSGVLNIGKLSLLNSTISQNRGESYVVGVGFCDQAYFSTGSTYLNHCTVISNFNSQGQITAAGSFSAENCILGDCKGKLVSFGHNLIPNSFGCLIIGNMGNLLNTDPKLGPLQDNGGPTFTHALLPGSPAINAADAAGLFADQRGFARPSDPLASDIGAFEFIPPGTLLQITRTATNTVVLSWLSSAAGFVLEENWRNLDPIKWSDVNATPVDDGTNVSVTVPVLAGNHFFRLRNP